MTNTQRETLQRISGMLFCLSFNSDVGEQAEKAMEMLNDLLQDDALIMDGDPNMFEPAYHAREIPHE